MRRTGGRTQKDNDTVPVFGSWRNAYIAVVAFFVVDVVAFYFFSRYFS